MKQTIYIVDDQAMIMEMTVMILRRMGPNWEVTGFEDPRAALAAVKANPPAAILTDQVMPGMEGSALLEDVRTLSPSTLRFIMSGCVSIGKLTLITAAHQYIAKPFEPSKIRELFERSFSARRHLDNPELLKLALSLRSIPSLPQAHHSLLKELEGNQGSSHNIAKLISTDPGLSTKVLHLANSGLFGHGSVVTDLADAVNALGTDMIMAILLSQSVFKHYEKLTDADLDLGKLWAHCWGTACAAQRLCRERRLRAPAGEEAFLAGLMHEMGRFILVDNCPTEFRAANELARRENIPLSAALRATFQSSPYQLSAYVLELWGLPAGVVNGIARLDEPEKEGAREFTMTTALYAGHQIASHATPPDPFAPAPWRMDYLESVGCADDVPEWEKRFKGAADGAAGK